MKSERFSGMKYKVHELPLDIDVFTAFPELKKISGLRTELCDNNRVMRYGLFLYDPKSDLIREIPQLKDRKEQALLLAGYKKVDGQWEQEAKEILHNLNTAVRDVMFVITTSVFHDRKMREYHTLATELHEYTKLRWTPVSKEDSLDEAKKKSLLRNECDSIHDKMDALEKEMWGDNTDVKEYVEQLLMTTPERVAMAYAKDYTEEEAEAAA